MKKLLVRMQNRTVSKFQCISLKREDQECCTKSEIVEIVAELGENDEKKINRTQRWSQKIKSNVNTVAEELENVIMQIGINDQ